ncbi:MULTISPECIES: FbpB family small basic protein [Bacillales]|nr:MULTISPECIES: FbpB family small basic protein [Bacillaceae]MBF0708555.1 FbpB family small basic protein [Pseudalkalibacillus hwajinpoensis]MDO6655744.1 FbpB family small basic protein [Anaerobacillus sp. 1_MG-2023]
MRKSKKVSFKELVMQNKLELMNDKQAIERIEDKFEQKHAKNL